MDVEKIVKALIEVVKAYKIEHCTECPVWAICHGRFSTASDDRAPYTWRERLEAAGLWKD